MPCKEEEDRRSTTTLEARAETKLALAMPCNRRTSERRAELAPAIPSEEEKGEARGGGSRKAITGSMLQREIGKVIKRQPIITFF